VEAHLVRATIPLFCESVVLGGVVPRAAKKAAMQSPSKPP
jgi:hypothetical protein